MTKAIFKRTLIAIAATSATLSSIQSMAQEATANAPEPESKAQMLDAVVVTAQKRMENARDVAVSISVIGSEQLENRHVSSLVDLAGALPGVQIDSGGTPGRTSIAMRGISSFDVGSVVGTYIDDSPVGSSSRFATAARYQLDLLPYDVERIEVLRGPQGTLYGASTMGGLLKYVMKDPDLKELSGAVGGGVSQISGSSGTGWDARAQINVPLIKNELAITASVSENRTPGYVDNAVTGKNDINPTKQQSGRLALRWAPTEEFSLKLSAMHQTIDSPDLGAILLDKNQQPLYGGDLKTGTVIPENFNSKVDFFGATLNWDLKFADLTSATSYSRGRSNNTKDDSAFYGPLYPTFGFPVGKSGAYQDLDLKKTTEELRLASKPGSQLEWLVGTFFTRETVSNVQLLTATANDGTPLPVLNPLLGVDEPSTYREAALFGDVTYKFTEKFDLTGGVRYARNKQHSAFTYTGVGKSLQNLTDSANDSSESVTTWMLSPRYHIDDRNMVYLRTAKGYRPGSPNLALPGVPPIVRSDTLINYEAGWKGLLLNKKLSVDTAVYRIDWKNIQLNNQTSSGVAYLANGGTARSEGMEISAGYTVNYNLRLGLTTAYTRARLTEDAPTLGGKSGDQIPGVPRWNAGVTADYFFNLPDSWSGHFGADYRFTGKRDSSFRSSATNWHENSSGVVGMNADASKGLWTVRIYAKNLTNQRPQQHIDYLLNGATGQIANLQSIVLQPRTIGLEVDAQF